MEQITYGNINIQFKVKRGRRMKTVALQIQPDSTVVVLSPAFLDTEKIKQIVLKRARWIIRKQEKIKRLKINITEKEFVSGESFLYLGRRYRLKVIKTNRTEDDNCRLINGRFYIEINEKLQGKAAASDIREKLIGWYSNQARDKIMERIEKYSKLLGVKPRKIIIKNQEKRWGSCSCSGIIRFNWKIIMAPMSVLDYVIIHELCHLIQQNHSPEFWSKVESIIPSFKSKREWLKENGFLFNEF